MSNALAIATVTATLRRTLQEAVQGEIAGARVAAVRPNSSGQNGVPALGVNIFLYQVSANPALRNADLPTRRHNGEVVQRPQVALNLDYLFSFYGEDTELEPQRLMGTTVRTLHARPLLTQAMITSTTSDASFSYVSGSDLADQSEQVKLSPLALSLEDLSKLWSVFFQVPYVLSAAYRASVVLIEQELQPVQPVPVRDYALHSFPIVKPEIERVIAQSGADQFIVAQAAVAVLGRHLQAQVTQVFVNDHEVTPTRVTNSRIEFSLPGGLRAGPQTLQIKHGLLLGSPPAPHTGVGSDIVEFGLHPQVGRRADRSYNIAIMNRTGTGTQPRSADIVVVVQPAVSEKQQVTLELTPTLTAGGVRVFNVAPLSAPGTHLNFPVSGLAPGDYLVRIRVHGELTEYDMDSNGQPTAPRITLT